MAINRTTTLDKIKALLSKTKENGCTEAEALSALDMARALMDAHEITDADLQLSKEESAILYAEPEADARDSLKIKWNLAYGISKFCEVQIYRDTDGRLKVIGLESDVDFAVWLLDHLADFVHNALFAHLIGCLAPKAERKEIIRGFVIGCCERIRDRMVALCKRSETARTSNGRELVVIKDHAIKAFMKDHDIHLRKGRRSTANFSDAAAEAGRAAGDQASFGRPISGKAGVLRLAGARS